MSADPNRVPLADAIAALRKEIRVAAVRAETVAPEERYKITEAEIELTVVAEDSGDVSIEVGWWILKANAQVSAKDSMTHKLRLKLNLGDVEVGSTQKTR